MATLRDLLNSIFRFKRTLITFWVVAALVIAVYYTQTARKYESRARILVSLGSENQGTAEYLNNKNMQLLQREQQIHNEQQILLSEHVLLTTSKWILGEPTPGEPAPPVDAEVLEARRFLTGDAPEPTLLLRTLKVVRRKVAALEKALPFWHKTAQIPESTLLATTLSKSLDAKTIFNSDALDVTFRYRDPRVAQTVLKLVLAAYIDHHIAVFQSAGESDLLKSELDSSVAQYHKQLDEMADFMTTHHVFSEDSQINSFIQQRQLINQELSDAAVDSQAAASRAAMFRGLNRTLKRYETYSTVESHSKLHDELESRLNEAQVQEQQILNGHPAQSRTYQDQVEVLKRIRQLLASEPAQIIDQKEDRRSGASELAEQQLISSNAAEESAEARIEQLKQELNSLSGTIDDYVRNLPVYNMIKLKLDFSKQQSEQMGQAYLNSRLRTLSAQSEITDVSVIDAPSWEPEPTSPKRSLVLLLAIALLLTGSVAILLISIRLDQTIRDRHTTETALGLPVAAVLPIAASEDEDAPVLLESRTENEFARIYVSVRNIKVSGTVILLAGSNSGEGLSLVSYELARFFERYAPSKVALLDCTSNPVDYRSEKSPGPALLTLPDQSGLSWRQEKSSTGAATVSTSDLLATWRNQYDYIVVACNVTKDIHRLVDILPSVNATYLVVEARRTRRATAISTLDLLRSYGINTIQLILNKNVYSSYPAR
jgi:polysaccharide biosynthesis protein PslE